LRKVRLFVGIITSILSVVIITEYLFEIMWGLLSIEEPELSIMQVIVVFITLLISGVISTIYSDINTIGFRLMQFALYFAGTGLIITAVRTEDRTCNIVKIWMSLATFLMLLILVFGKTGEEKCVLQNKELRDIE